MKPLRIIAGLWLTAAGTLLPGCEKDAPFGPDLASQSSEIQGNMQLDLDVCSPGAGGFTTVSTNPYFPTNIGDQWAYEGEEDGVPVSLLITVLGETRLIDTVTTRVIEEREWEDGELLEVSWNYYAQAGDGTICYFGEDVDIYEEEGSPTRVPGAQMIRETPPESLCPLIRNQG